MRNPTIDQLPNISKIFKKGMHGKISDYFETIFSNFQCRFRQGYRLWIKTVCCPWEKTWKKIIDPRKKYSELLTDLSNAPDFLANDLLVTKLNSYGFSIVSLNLINDYSTQLKQSVKINNSAHGWIFYLMCLKSLF